MVEDVDLVQATHLMLVCVFLMVQILLRRCMILHLRYKQSLHHSAAKIGLIALRMKRTPTLITCPMQVLCAIVSVMILQTTAT